MANQIKYNLKTVLYLTVVILLSSCQATSFLQKDQTFLRKNKIIFESHEKIEDKIFLNQELSTLFYQKPNKSVFWVPNQWFYYVTKNKTGTFNNWLRKYIAEAPSIYDSLKAVNTTKKFEEYLKNNKGFYNAKVKFKTYQTKYLTDVDYVIYPGKRYHIRSVKYECEDTLLCKIIDSLKNDSHLNVGKPVNSQDYNLEKLRITNALQNRGYALFNQNFIELLGDSSDYKVDLKILIHNPAEKSHHEIFTIGSINVYTDYYPSQKTSKLDSTIIKNISFYKELDNYLVKPSILSDIITLQPGELYNKSENRKIYNKLTDFRIYRFVSIQNLIDTLSGNKIIYYIYLNTHEKRNYREGNIVMNYATLSKKEKFVEFEGGGVLLNRKLSSRGDNLLFSGSGDIRIDLTKIENSQYNILGRIDYLNPISPKTIEISPLYLYFSAFQGKKYSNLKNYSSTKSSISYRYLLAPGNFLFSTFDFSYGYSFSPHDNLTILSNQLGINYHAPEILDDKLFGEFQKKSMNKVFITGLFLKNFALNYSSNRKRKLFNYKLSFTFETSGTEIYLTNKLYNGIFSKNEIWRFNNEINYSKYFKTSIDFVPQYKLGATSSLVGRIFMGIGVPYGDSDILPYTKQFDVGGPNSMRAWAIRELGPGSYQHIPGSIDELPYQKGDMRLETNLEYRFKVSYLIKSALFVDAGNIWTLKYDKERSGSLFTKDFAKQIAVDMGISFQLDLIVLLRVDLAYKLRNPYPDSSNRYWGFDLSSPSFVFAIDHPF